MSIIQITVYECSDGNRFDYIEDAEYHEKKSLFHKEVLEHVKLQDYQCWYDEDVAEMICRDYEKLVSVFDKYKGESDGK